MAAPEPKLRDLFDEALSCPTPEEQAAYLERACRGDADLRARVEELLVAHREAGSFLGEAAAPTAVTVDEPMLPDDPPTAVGPYKLLQKIGEGGMGTVFMAEQTQPVHRKVALKVIKPGMDSRQVIARFEAERQALAMMDHANIARVFDGGTTPEGRPYFVMELVHGIPITQYCDDNRLTPRERLELFVPVCQAIQHAHQKGVIHRDVKPTNVLVTLYDGRPVPKVIDFGVAKATERRLTERTLFTQYGTIVGTLEYMSPEQAEMSALGVDTRGDIYSLGVLLYELLTGSTPLTHRRVREAAGAEIIRMIKEEEPPRPSARLSDSGEALASISANRHMEPARLTKLVRGELDWIVMKALEKDRNRRYETASGFAMDVQRYLADEPVQACPPSNGYRLRKFARRNQRVLTAALAFVLLLVTAVVALSIALVAVSQERRDKEVALEAEAKRRKQARAALDAMTSHIVEDWLAKQTVLLPMHRDFLEEALRAYEEFAADTGTDEESRAGVAQAYGRVATIRDRLGQWREAEAGFRRARELYEGLVADFPEVHAHKRHLAQTDQNLGVLFHRSGRAGDAVTVLNRALGGYRRLASAMPQEPAYRHGVATSLDQLGISLKNLGRAEEAEEVYRQAVAILKPLASEFATQPEYSEHLAQALNNLGVLLDVTTGRSRPALSENSGRSGEALEAFEQAAALYTQLSADYPLIPLYRDGRAKSLDSRAGILRDEQRFPEAEATFRQVLDIRRQLVADFHAVPEYRQGLAVSLNNLGILLKNTDRAGEAEGLYRQALDVHRQLAIDLPNVPDHQNNVAGALSNLARLLLVREDFEGARRLYEEAVPYHLAALKAGPHHPAYRNFYRVNRWRMAETLLGLKEHEAAAEAAGQFLEMAVEPPRDAYTAACLFAGCVRLAARDESLDENRRRGLAATYGDSALAALYQALEKDAKELTQLAKDASLDPLRSRPDFQKLLADLELKKVP